MHAQLIKTYKGSQSGTARDFRMDAAQLAAQGYVPTSQNWQRTGEDVVLWHGLLSFVYVLRKLIRPAGTLTVTYEYRPATQGTEHT